MRRASTHIYCGGVRTPHHRLRRLGLGGQCNNIRRLQHHHHQDQDQWNTNSSSKNKNLLQLFHLGQQHTPARGRWWWWSRQQGRTTTTMRLMSSSSSSSSNNNSGGQHAAITTSRQARILLGIPLHGVLEMSALRKAYFVAAKQCHPDTASSSSPSSSSSSTSVDQNDGGQEEEKVGYERFLHVTEAYELLAAQLATAGASSHHQNQYQQRRQQKSKTDDDTTLNIPQWEEESFRSACQQRLGLSAEIVEECKSSAGFRQWLLGNTDSAHLCRDFLMQHGGLAPQLNRSSRLAITAGASSGTGVGGGEPPLRRNRRW